MSEVDAANGEFTFVIEATDINGETASDDILLYTDWEFPYLKVDCAPFPAYDLVNNTTLTNLTDPNADLILSVDEVPCGDNCIQYRYSFLTNNETRFYA